MSSIKANRAIKVGMLKQNILDLISQTQLEYIATSLLPGFSPFQIRKALKEMRIHETSLVVGSSVFKDELKQKYELEAQQNIPQIYFGPNGYKQSKDNGAFWCNVFINPNFSK